MLKALLVAVGSTLAVSVAAAAGPVVYLPAAAGAALAPGQVIEVRWSGIPGGVDEMELLLSLDGGRHFPVRVTPDLDADHSSYAWRVPALPSAAACLAIRVNRDGREVIAGRSPLFRIRAAPAPRLTPLRRRGGELWLDLEGAGDGVAGSFGFTAGAPRHSLASGPPAASSLPPPSPRAARSRPRAAAGSGRHRSLLAGAAERSAGALPAPLVRPLRI